MYHIAHKGFLRKLRGPAKGGCTIMYMFGIGGDVCDRLDYETHATDKTMRFFL